MRRYLFSTICFVTLPVLPVAAQNYMPLNNYSGAGVVVNMDVLSGSAPASLYGNAPTMVRDLPPVMPRRPAPHAPVALRPPVKAPMAAPARAAAPSMPAPVAAMPSAPATRSAPKYSSPLAPVRETMDEAVTETVSKPVSPPVSKSATTAAAAPIIAPRVNLLSNDQPTSSKPIADLISDEPTGGKNGNRQELASYHEPIPEDLNEVINDKPSIRSMEPVDEMAPETNRKMAAIAPVEKPASLPAAKNDNQLSPVTPPAVPSPMADRPGKKSGIQTAMLSPVKPVGKADPENFEAYRLVFTPSSPELAASETAVLDKIVDKMNALPDVRLQVRAYANGTPETASAARRLSLSRALKVREYLMAKNVVATRLDIRALGSGSVEMGDEVGRSNAPGDRVDLVFVE